VRHAWLLALLAGCGSSPPVDKEKERDANAEYQLALQAFEAKELDLAIRHADEALALSPKFPQAFLVRGKARQAKGDSPEEDFGKAVDAAPEGKRAIYLFHRGRWHQDAARLDRALADFQAACELQKQSPIRDYYFETFLERGRTLAAMGRSDEAIRDYDFLLASTHDDATRRQLEALRIDAVRNKKPGGRDK
jgi:tetratricopeptide (TPR) repeat protein